MAERFIGKNGIGHVAQPEGTEFCFAACVASLFNGDVSGVQMSLENAYISLADGVTDPPKTREEIPLLGEDYLLVIDPIQTPDVQAGDTLKVVEEIAEKLQEGSAVALMYKKEPGFDDDGYHWVVLAGYLEDHERVNHVLVMDPLAEEIRAVDPEEVLDMIDRSINFMGIFAYSIELVAS